MSPRKIILALTKNSLSKHPTMNFNSPTICVNYIYGIINYITWQATFPNAPAYMPPKKRKRKPVKRLTHCIARRRIRKMTNSPEAATAEHREAPAKARVNIMIDY